MSNFVFLDIDGVLNIGGKQKPLSLSEDLVKQSNKIGNSDTIFVLTSSWGLYYDIDFINKFMKNSGFNHQFKEYLLGEEHRAVKICNYIDKNVIENHAVVDDRDIKLEGCVFNFVKVDSSVGITKKNVDDINDFLI